MSGSRWYLKNKKSQAESSERPDPDADYREDDDGKNIWKDEKTTVSNRELKSMVEFYKKDLIPKYDIPEL